MQGDRVFGRLWREAISSQIGRLGLAAIAMAVVSASAVATAYLTKNAMDGVFIAKDPAALKFVTIGVLILFLARTSAAYVQEVLLAGIGQRIILALQSRLFGHLLRQDVAILQESHSGTIVSHFTFDVSVLRDTVSTALVAIGRDTLQVIGLVGYMAWIDWRLTLIALIAAPAALFPVQIIATRMRKVSTGVQTEMGRLTRDLAQAFQAIRVIKIFGMERHEERRMAERFETLLRLNLRAVKIAALSQPMIDILGGIATAAVLYYVGTRVIEGTKTPGDFVAFMAAVASAFQPLRTLSRVVPTVQQGLAAASRIFALLDAQARIVDKPAAPMLERRAGSVRFDDVHFTYADGKSALRGTSFTAPAGKVTALVGPSGAGKSTVLNLIPRFFDPSRGAVFVNECDVASVTQPSLRDSLSLVSQDATLFDDTIMANIRYGRISARDEEVIEAARAAAADEFIRMLPQGYETLVGEHGLKMSGGQRQRIAIARAILKDAPILLLDEATSALDSESERRIQEALDRLVKGRTTLVIAHRLSTIRSADVIHVFEGGRVVESGTHNELLVRGGIYARLHDLQFAGA